MSEDTEDISDFRGLARSRDEHRPATEILREARERDDERVKELIEKYGKDEEES